jgi:hypothetical protein
MTHLRYLDVVRLQRIAVGIHIHRNYFCGTSQMLRYTTESPWFCK